MFERPAEVMRRLIQDDAEKRGLTMSGNPANASTDSFPVLGGVLAVGMVRRAGVGLYDADVRLSNCRNLPCHMLTTASSDASGLGVSMAQLIPETTPVLVWAPDPKATFGIIIAVLPTTMMSKLDMGYNEQPPRPLSTLSIDQEPGAAENTEASFKEIRRSPQELNKLLATADRPPDLFQGDLAQINDMGVGLHIRRVMAALKASDGAKLEVFTMDDLLRLVSGQYQHFSALGEQHIYNSHGGVTMEFLGSGHQCEVQGREKFGIPLVHSAEPDLESYKDARLQHADVDPDPAMLRRFHMVLGALGGIFQFFVSHHDPTYKHEYYTGEGDGTDSDVLGRMSDPVKDRGHMHLSLGDNGDVYLRSAGDIILQRSDHTPVPKKLKEPWDPSGDNTGAAAAKKPYQFAGDTALSHTVQLRDSLIWQDKMSYGGLIAGAYGSKNWYLPEEQEVGLPEDEYDKVVHSMADFSKNADKTCRFILRRDGGITMQDDKGAEISLVDGKVIISAPKGVEIRSGTDIVAMAQTDLNLKARNSVDISATEHDVRIKAERNLEAYALGVLIESSAPADYPTFTGVGEDAELSGINLVAPNSRVFMYGQTAHVSGQYDVIIESVEKSDEGLGTIQIAAQAIVASAGREINLLVNKESSLILNQGEGSLTGPVAVLAGRDTVAVLRGTKAWQPFAEVDIPEEISNYFEHTKFFDDGWPTHGESFDWLEMYEPKARTDMVFTHRTEEQYHTDTADFSVYESLWAFVGRTGGGDTPGPWSENPIRNTTPWPGYAHYTGGETYKQLSSEPNVLRPAIGTAVDFAERTSGEGVIFNGVPFSSYIG